jgi:hypothetical protein
MRRRTRFLLLAMMSIAPALTACGHRAQADRYPEVGEGRLAAQVGGKTMLHSAAQATYCRGDSVLVVVAVTSRWAAGLALRGAFPVVAARDFSVGGSLAGSGSATAAFRAVTDSVEPALVGAGGTVRLEPGRLATGRFDVTVPAADARSRPRRILGAFRALPTTDTTSTCSGTPRTT